MTSKKIYIPVLVLFICTQLYSQAGSFISIPVDSRSVSMGNTFLASENGNVLYTNPAASSLSDKKSGIDLNYRPWVTDQSDGNDLLSFSAYYALNGKHSIALGGRNYAMPYYYVHDNNGNLSGTYDPVEYSLGMSYAYNLSDRTAMSVSIHYIDSEYGENQTANTLAFDFGFKTAIKNIDFGFMVRNSGPELDFGTGNSELPLSIAAGMAYTKTLTENHHIKLAFDASHISYNDESGFSGGLGMEYCYKSFLFLRSGYYYIDENLGLEALTMGCGLNFKDFKVDFAYLSSANALNYNYSLSCSWALFKNK